jgi:hypothetical protein
LDKAFSPIDEGFLPWRRDFSLFVEDFGLGEGIFLLLKGFSLGEGVFLLGFSRVLVRPGRGEGEASLFLLQGEGLTPLARAYKPLSGTGRGGKDLAPNLLTLPFSRGLTGLF